MRDLPPGYSVRGGRRDDVPTVAAVEAAYDTALLGAPYMDQAWTLEDWSRTRFDPAVDAWLISAADGQVVAYGHACDEEGNGFVESVARVHPDHWGRGLGSWLVERIEARARELLASEPTGSLKLLNDITADDEPAAALLKRAGYEIDRHFWHMHLDLSGSLPDRPPPDGIEIRPFDRAVDAEAVHEVLETAFEAHYLYHPTSFDKWTAEQLDKPTFDAGLWLVAVESGRVVGALSGRILLGEGWVSDLGVLVPWRGRGLGAALLARSFRTFKEKGFGTVALNVDAANETGATALYERVGMSVRLKWDLYAKTLTRPDPAT